MPEGKPPVLASVQSARRHPVVTAVVLLLAGATVWLGHWAGHGGKAIWYVGAMLACVLLTDVLMRACERWRGVRPADPAEVFPVRRPAREAALVAGCAVVGLAALLGTSIVGGVGPATPVAAKLAFFAARLLGIALLFPVIPAISLLMWGYRPRTLGFAWPRPVAGVLVAVPVQGVVITMAYLAAPEDVTWSQIMEEVGGGGVAMTVMKLVVLSLMAAVPEEFFRLMCQTRVGAVARNQAVGWVIAVLLWGAMHVPHAVANQPAERALWMKIGMAFLGTITMAPIGLMWSYVAWRCRSLWPAMALHATNVWGLQNL
jgi:membrane protease YdiL (CAAX protease family)